MKGSTGQDPRPTNPIKYPGPIRYACVSAYCPPLASLSLTIHFACVILKHMKSVSLRHMQHHLSDVMRHVDQGQEVLVTRRRRTIARLVPMQPATARVKWPDFAARTTLIKGPPLSTTILADRE